MIKKTGKFSAIGECTRCHKHYGVKNFYGAQKSPIGDLCEICKKTISTMQNITQTNLLTIFTYDEVSGALTHRYTTVSGFQGELATFDHQRGYLSVCIGKKQYLAHRIIYLMKTGKWPNHVDHINHIKKDNSWVNLRNVSQETNNRNMPQQGNSSTGVVGVSLHKPTGKYRAYVSVKSKAKHLGLFDSISDAKIAREAANKQYAYHQNHGK